MTKLIISTFQVFCFFSCFPTNLINYLQKFCNKFSSWLFNFSHIYNSCKKRELFKYINQDIRQIDHTYIYKKRGPGFKTIIKFLIYFFVDTAAGSCCCCYFKRPFILWLQPPYKKRTNNRNFPFFFQRFSDVVLFILNGSLIFFLYFFLLLAGDVYCMLKENKTGLCY